LIRPQRCCVIVIVMARARIKLSFDPIETGGQQSSLQQIGVG
jgi:hypothetical protein